MYCLKLEFNKSRLYGWKQVAFQFQRLAASCLICAIFFIDVVVVVVVGFSSVASFIWRQPKKKWHGISCHIYHHCLISISARQSIYRFIRSLLCLRGVARVFVIIICVSVVSAFISQPQSLQYYLVHNLCGPTTKFHFFFHSSSLHNKIYGRFPFNFRAYCILEDIASAEETPESE